MAGDKDFAFRYLEKCLQSGGDLDVDTLKTDADLTGLRADPRWETLLKTVADKEAQLVGTLPVKHEGTPVPLPEPKRDGAFSVEKALAQRRSVREYLDAPLSLEEVSQLLWSAYGVTEKIENAPPFLRGGLKTAPSAGALYPLEIYLVAGKVTGLPAGVYLYKPEGHALLKVREGDVRDPLCQACLGQTMARKAPVSLVYSAVYERTTKKYGERGRERYVCMDLGHSAENVYLQATALKMGTCAIGAFTDLKLRLVTHMTREEAPLYVMPVGKTAE
ncbi:MAG: SagB/ThcOx family dehydrogenase [Acidobacteria bacterium]|nr:SagB/ThcOx family dehydrogenase [Acidobacteriota bacterium]